MPLHEAPVVGGYEDVCAAVPRRLQPHGVTVLQRHLAKAGHRRADSQHLLALLQLIRPLPADALQDHIQQALGSSEPVVDTFQVGARGFQWVLNFHTNVTDVDIRLDQIERHRVVGFCSVLRP